jgi:hypothetical protein
MIMLSILTPVEDVLTWTLEEFHTSLGLTWAWSVIALTLVVRMLLVPLTVRQIHSMQRMQQYLPQMKEIQKRYKADRKKQNEELMKFYKEHQINPASSCLPILPQIPIFFALYFVLPRRRVVLVRERPDRQGDGRRAGDPDRPLRRLATLLDAVDVDHDGPDAADDLPGAAVRLRDLHRQSARRRDVSGRPAALLDDDEPVDGRAGNCHSAASGGDQTGASQAHLADAAENRPADAG